MPVTYKGFELSPSNLQIADSGRWDLTIQITKHHDIRNETLTATYTANKSFETKAEAEIEAIRFGKDIIDGNTNSSIEGLL